MRRMIGRLVTVLLLCMVAGTGAAEAITVAAAADLQFALREIAHNYEKKTGNTVKLTFGSSGALASQIQNGAPFDVFFSADASYPDMLVKKGAADGKTLFRYARGVLVLWVENGRPLSGNIGGIVMADLNALTAPGIEKVAIANPQHAPYGRAAVDALKKAGVYAKIADKLVMGENVSQAAQFAESGNAQAALLPLSLAQAAISLKDRGRYASVPPDLYRPIIQAAVVTKQAQDAAAAQGFLRYVLHDGVPILRRYGFETQELNPPPVVVP